MECGCPSCQDGHRVQTMEAFMAHAVPFELPPNMPGINGVCRSLLRVQDESGKEVRHAHVVGGRGLW